MNVLDILDELEAEIKASPYVPISDARAVDVETLQRLLSQLRDASRPDAQAVEESEEQIVGRAQNLAKLEVIAAHREAARLLSGERIYALAQSRSAEIIAASEASAQELLRDAYSYAQERYQEGHQRLQRISRSLRDALKTAAEESRVQKGRRVAQRAPGVVGGVRKRRRVGRMVLALLSLAARFAARER
jgi:hypothetical protein